MELYVLISILAVLAGIGAFFLLRKARGPAPSEPGPAEPAAEPADTAPQTVRFEELSALTQEEEAALVEIRGPSLLAKIDNALSGTLQILGNAGALEEYQRGAGDHLDENRRRRQGVEGFVMNIPAIFNREFRYRELSERTADSRRMCASS